MGHMCEENRNPEENQNQLVPINGVRVRLVNGREVLRHDDCAAEDNESAVMDRTLPNPFADDPDLDTEDERFRCYVCGRQVDAVWRRLYPPLNA